MMQLKSMLVATSDGAALVFRLLVALVPLFCFHSLNAAECDGESVFGEVATVAGTEKRGMALCLRGNRLYFGARNTLYVFDVAMPLAPKLLGKCAGIGPVRQIAVDSDVAFVTTRETGLWLVDVKDPEKPTVISRFDTIELATGIDVCGGVAFVGQRQNGVEFVDVRDPRHPEHIRIEKTGESQSVCYRNGICYSGDWGCGELTVIDARDLSKARVVRTVPLFGHGDGLDVYGDRLLIATGHHRHFKKSDGRMRVPTKPSQDGFGAGHGIELFDIADPMNPKRLGRVDFDAYKTLGADWWTVRFGGDGRYAFCADSHNGLYVVDLTQMKTVGRKIFSCGTQRGDQCSSFVSSVAVGEKAVYAAVDGLGLAVIPCAVAEQRKQTMRVAPQGHDFRQSYSSSAKHFTSWVPSGRGQVRGVSAKGDVVYVACGQAGLSVLRCDGGTYRECVTVKMPFCGDVKVRGDKLYSAEGLQGLAVYDLNDSEKLREVERVTKFPKSICCPQWVWAPTSSTYVVVSCRVGGYQLLDPGKDWRLVAASGGCPGWDRYYVDEPLECRWFAQSYANRGFAWIDCATTPAKVIVCPRNRAGMNDGCLAWRGNRLLRVCNGTFEYLNPGQPENADGTAWRGVPIEGADAKAGGQPAWNGGNRIALTRRIGKEVRMVDMTDENHPRTLWTEIVAGHPDTGLFHNGRLLVPAGYQGLLIEKK